MGQYKVPQNVEAEDKIIGPLTFKQFIYALIGLFWGLICFALFRKAIPIMILIGGPPVTLFMLLAFYTRDGQNFEQLLIAIVGFFANPRRRTWIKEDVIEALHITPKPVVVEATQRNPVLVRSELDRIAAMVDSRGWQNPAAASVAASHESPIPAPAPATLQLPKTPASTPEIFTSEPSAKEDIMDLQHSPLARNLSDLINEAAEDVRQEALDQMKATHMQQASAQAAPAPVVTQPSPSGIVELATQRDDLTVSQLAATATRLVPMPSGQVVEVRNNGNTGK